MYHTRRLPGGGHPATTPGWDPNIRPIYRLEEGLRYGPARGGVREVAEVRNQREMLPVHCCALQAQHNQGAPGARPRSASNLKTVCHSIAKEMDLVNSPCQSGPSVIPTKLRRSINTRRKAWRKVLRLLKDPTSHDVEIDEAEAWHLHCQKKASSAVSKFRRKLWQKRVKKVHANLLHNPRQFWQWASYTAKWNLKPLSGGIQPIKNSEGELVVTLPEILEAWRHHYKKLATDVSGNSGDPTKWNPIAEDDSLNALPNIDQDIQQEDLWRTVRRMKQYTAPGDDGIPTDFFRAILKAELLQRMASHCQFGRW